MRTTLTVTLILALAATAGAQVIAHETQATAAAQKHLQIQLERTPAAGLHVAVESLPVKGAPYTGEAVTESVQVLADGNRIVRRTTTRVARDSAGRTRRETLGPDGRVLATVISDPAAGTSYVLEPDTNTARRVRFAVSFVPSGGAAAEHVSGTGGAAVHLSSDVEAKVIQEASSTMKVTAGEQGMKIAAPFTWVSHETEGATQPSTEDLGQQTIEGVLASGSRSTTVIPAGAIGNEQPITVVSEEWTSPELQVRVATKYSDPRVGETTYRLTNISRTEPGPEQFQVPAGYTIK